MQPHKALSAALLPPPSPKFSFKPNFPLHSKAAACVCACVFNPVFK